MDKKYYGQFNCDGRTRIHPPITTDDTIPLSISAASARRLIDEFIVKGYSIHSKSWWISMDNKIFL